MDIEQVNKENIRKTFYGANVTLYRWMLNESKHQSLPRFDFMIWGYFDQMNIKSNMNSIKDFYFEQGSRENVRLESQRMCIYTNQKRGMDLLRPDLCIGEKHFPLIVITEIKFNNPNKNKSLIDMTYSEYISYCEKRIKDKINEKINANINSQQEILFHDFYSLGYSDLVIVFRGQSYFEIINLVKDIRKLSIYASNELQSKKNNKNDSKIISSTYSITGTDIKQSRHIVKESMKLSVRISLKPSCDLKKALRKISQDLKLDIKNIHPVYGKYDLDIVFPINDPWEYINVCGINKNSILNPSSNYYREYINYRNTRWIGDFDEDILLEEGESKANTKRNSYESKKISDEINELSNICNFLNENKVLTEPLYNAFWLLTKCYIQIIQNNISEKILSMELKKIFTSFISIFFWNLELSEKEQRKIRESGKISYKSHNTNAIDINSFEAGINLVNELLQNRIHASRMIFEMPSYNQNLIDKSTDIAKVYSIIVNIINIEALNKFKAKFELIFFIIFTNTLEIETYELFPAFVEKSKKRLLGINLNSMSFYDFKYSIPYIIHEMGHYIDPINHNQVNDAFHKCISIVMSQIICGELFDSLQYKGNSAKRFSSNIKDSIGFIINNFSNIIKENTSISLNLSSMEFNNYITNMIWGFFFDISNEKLKNENCENLLIDSCLINVCDRFRTYIKTKKIASEEDNNEVDGLINTLSYWNLLENRHSNFENILDKMFYYFSNKKNYYEFIDFSNHYFELFGEIIADFVMISILDLKEDFYIDLINYYFKMHGGKHGFEDFNNEFEIRHGVLANAEIITCSTSPTSDVVKNEIMCLEPLAKILKEFNVSSEWKSFINSSSITKIRNLYIDEIQMKSNSKSFSNEIAFILSMQKDY